MHLSFVLLLLERGGCDVWNTPNLMPGGKDYEVSKSLKEKDNDGGVVFRKFTNLDLDEKDKKDLINRLTYQRCKHVVHLYQQVASAIYGMLHTDIVCCHKHVMHKGRDNVYGILLERGKKFARKANELLDVDFVKRSFSDKQVPKHGDTCMRDMLVDTSQRLFDDIYDHFIQQSEQIWKTTKLPPHENVELVFWKKLKADLVPQKFIKDLDSSKDSAFMQNIQSIDPYVNAPMTDALGKVDLRTLQICFNEVVEKGSSLRENIVATLKRDMHKVNNYRSGGLKHTWSLRTKNPTAVDSGFHQADKEALIFLFTNYTDQLLQYFIQKLTSIDMTVLDSLKGIYGKLQKELYSDNDRLRNQAIKEIVTLVYAPLDTQREAPYRLKENEEKIHKIDACYMVLDSLCNTLYTQHAALKKRYDALQKEEIKRLDEKYEVEKELSAEDSKKLSQIIENYNLCSEDHPSEKFWTSLEEAKKHLKLLENESDKKLKDLKQAVKHREKKSAFDSVIKWKLKLIMGKQDAHEKDASQTHANDNLLRIIQIMKMLAKADIMSNLRSVLQENSSQAMSAQKNLLQFFSFEELRGMNFSGGAELFSLFKPEVKSTEVKSAKRRSFTGSAPTMVAITKYIPDFLPSSPEYMYTPYVKGKCATENTPKGEITKQAIQDIEQQIKTLKRKL